MATITPELMERIKDDPEWTQRVLLGAARAYGALYGATSDGKTPDGDDAATVARIQLRAAFEDVEPLRRLGIAPEVDPADCPTREQERAMEWFGSRYDRLVVSPPRAAGIIRITCLLGGDIEVNWLDVAPDGRLVNMQTADDKTDTYEFRLEEGAL
jgi:hypothetical protein